MDGFSMTKPLAPATTNVPNAESALCCAAASSIQPPGGVLRSWVGNRRVLAVAGLGVTGSGLALGWGWLTTVGIAPLIVAAALCLIMCALGLCMMPRGSSSNVMQSFGEQGNPPELSPISTRSDSPGT
jgi:hypothetical protein